MSFRRVGSGISTRTTPDRLPALAQPCPLLLQTDEEVEILADIPGLRRDEILVDVDRNTITLQVEPPVTAASHISDPATPLSHTPSAQHAQHATPAASARCAVASCDLPGGASRSGAADRVVRRIHCRERARPFSRRTLQLPGYADFKRAAASYCDGVLRVSIPKLEHAPAKRVRVL